MDMGKLKRYRIERQEGIVLGVACDQGIWTSYDEVRAKLVKVREWIDEYIEHDDDCDAHYLDDDNKEYPCSCSLADIFKELK